MRIQTPHGIIELGQTDERVVNPGGSTSDIRHWTIRMSDDQSSPAIPLQQVGQDQGVRRLLSEQASWLKHEGNIRDLEPRTVVIAQNQTQEGSFIARWHGNDRPGSGQLTELLVPTSQGYRQVPPEVLSQVPEQRITDAVRPNATSFDYIVPRDGSAPRWDARYLDENNQRVQLTFASNNELAVREVVSNNPSQGSVITFGPGSDDLRRPAGTISVPEGSRLIREQGAATVINAAGDMRIQWNQGADGAYREDRRIEHLYVNGRPSDWRVATELPENTSALYRVDGNNRQIGETIPVQRGENGRLIIPNSQRTADLENATLGIPSGTGIGIAEQTQRRDASIVTRGVTLGPEDTPYSIRESIEQKAGYTNPSQANWIDQRVELTRSIAERLDIPVPAGQNTVVTNVEILPHSNAAGRFSMRDGTELAGSPDSARDLVVIRNMNEQTRLGSQVAVTEFQGAFMVPSGGRPAHEVLRSLAEQGLEPVAVLGTGFITPSDKRAENQTPILGYHYTNFARLEEGREGRSAIQPTEVRDPNNGTNLRAGYWVDSQGNTHLLNLDRQRFPQPQQVDAELERMKNDPNVAAIHLYTHRAAQSPADLIGNPPYDKDQGNPGWTPRPEGKQGGQYDTDPSNNAESRSFLVFDAQGDMLGRMSTPPVTTRDTFSVAQEVYGDRAKYVLNGDGDFYSRAWYVDQRRESDPLALGYENAMILVRPTQDGQPAPLREFTETERSAIRDYRHQETTVDNWNDFVKRWERFWDGVQDVIPRPPWAPGPDSTIPPLSNAPGQSNGTTASVTDTAAQAPTTVAAAPMAQSGTPSITESRTFPDILAGVRMQDDRVGRTPDQLSVQLAAALSVDAERKQLMPPVEVGFNDQGTRAFAVERNAPNSEHKLYAQVDVAAAVNQPLSVSNAQYSEVRDTLALQKTQQQTETVARSADDPTRNAIRLA